MADKCPLCKVLIGGPMDLKPWWEDHIEMIILGALGCIYNRYAFYMRNPEPSTTQEMGFIMQCTSLCNKELKGRRQDALDVYEKMRHKAVADPYTHVTTFAKALLKFLLQHVLHPHWNKDAMKKAFYSYASSIGMENDNY
jgi:hypothetical protein